MTYEEALDNVYGRLVFGIKPGLERISALLDRLYPDDMMEWIYPNMAVVEETEGES